MTLFLIFKDGQVTEASELTDGDKAMAGHGCRIVRVSVRESAGHDLALRAEELNSGGCWEHVAAHVEW